MNAQTVLQEKKKFRHTDNNISFFVAAPSFIDEKQVAYSYLLEGSGNKKWSDTSSANSIINLTLLSAGNYLLKVKAFFPSTTYAPAASQHTMRSQYPFAFAWYIYYRRNAAQYFFICERMPSQHCKMLVTENPAYFRKDLPKYIPQLFVLLLEKVNWSFSPKQDPIKLMEENFPIEKLQAMIDK